MLKQLLARQAELNSQLDMEKGDLTGRGFCARSWHDLDMGKGVPVATGQLGKMADGICELPTLRFGKNAHSSDPPPQSGTIKGKAVAKDAAYVVVRPQLVASSLSRSRHLSERPVISGVLMVFGRTF
jgi:hypothetical protein